jgi:hypothetical protein
LLAVIGTRYQGILDERRSKWEFQSGRHAPTAASDTFNRLNHLKEITSGIGEAAESTTNLCSITWFASRNAKMGRGGAVEIAGV